MEKGESIISAALTVLVVLVAIGVQRQWSSTILGDMASSAEDFVLKTTGLRDAIPELPGNETVRTFRLGRYTAGLYRPSPAPSVFADYHFILFDNQNRPAFRTESIEASAMPWTTLYDFSDRRGLPAGRRRGHPEYRRDLTGDGSPDILLGQYSGGDHCCTTVTVIELGRDKARTIGQITGLDGLPFEGLDLRRFNRRGGWELVAHRPYRTVCGLHADAADVISLYAYEHGQFRDATRRFQPFLARVLAENLSRWKRARARSLHLLQSIAVDYAATGKTAAGQQFFQQNVPLFYPQIKAAGDDPKACTQDVANLVDSLQSNP